MVPGLSVLIPVFNCDVNELVDSLLAQQTDWPGPVEIILFDDGSNGEFRVLNQSLADRFGVRYHELAHNVGRAAIRNQLAAAAQHEWLLLLDNDSLLPDSQFLARYAAAHAFAPVLIGGTCYAPLPPSDPSLHLRWCYGQAREARPAAVRQQQPHMQLTVNNALVQAAILAQFPLDEQMSGYGHEDTKFGLTLAEAGIEVFHLDNPVLHNGLESGTVFLRKSEEGVRNLVQVYRHCGAGTHSRLLRLALRLRGLGVAAAARAVLVALEPRLQRKVLSTRPSLRAFDLLRLSWLLKRL